MEIFAYCLATKSKEKMLNPVISKTSKGGYICKGITEGGYKISLIMSKVNAEAAVESGILKEGW